MSKSLFYPVSSIFLIVMTCLLACQSPLTSTTTTLAVIDNRTPLSLSWAVTTLYGAIGADGTGSEAMFHHPNGITSDGTNLYVTDTDNHTVRKVETATGTVTTLAGLAGNSGSNDGTGSAARFYYPRGITTDGTNLYVADTFNNIIRKIQ